MLAGIVEFLGWFGAVTVLTGYILFSSGKIPNGPLYQLFNLVGGLSVAINVAAHHAIPSTIVNGIWAVVAVVVLAKMARARLAAKRGEPVVADQAVLHAEPPATTAVLPVIGPALRDHETAGTATDASDSAPTDATDAAAHATDAAAHATDAAAAADSTDPGAAATSSAEAAPRLQSDADADADAPAATPAAAAPMTESVPVITATIALALVAAAQDQASQESTSR